MGRLSLTWQYNGLAPWVEITEWCKTHCERVTWSRRSGTIFFYTEADYTMFLLRWSGR